MATPESNSLLALQLFDKPAQEYAQRSDQLNRVLLGLAQEKREMDFRREQAANVAGREDARWKAQGEREDARIKGYEARQEASIKAQEARLQQSAKEKERADIENEVDRLYPQYAAAAARAGLPIKQRDEFQSTRAGLGQLAAELQTAVVGYDQNQKELSAEAAVSELEEKKAAIADAKRRFEALSKPTPEDERMARSNAVAAVKQAIENGDLESTKPLSKKARTDGIAALAKGDLAVARKILGEEAIRAYETGFDQTLMQLPNVKARMQDQRLAYQEYQTVLADARRVDSDLRKAQATNPFLAKKLKESRSGLTPLFTPEEAPRKSTFEDFTPPRASSTEAQPAPAAAAVPEPQTNYQYPGLSVFGAGERVIKSATPERWAQVPGNLATLLSGATVVDAASRYGGAGLRGLFTGDYTVPEKGPLERSYDYLTRAKTPPSAVPQVQPQPQPGVIDWMVPGSF